MFVSPHGSTHTVGTQCCTTMGSKVPIVAQQGTLLSYYSKNNLRTVLEDTVVQQWFGITMQELPNAQQRHRIVQQRARWRGVKNCLGMPVYSKEYTLANLRLFVVYLKNAVSSSEYTAPELLTKERFILLALRQDCCWFCLSFTSTTPALTARFTTSRRNH